MRFVAPTTEERLDEMQDHIRAMKLLLLAHLTAADMSDVGTVDTTLKIAKGQLQAARDQGKLRIALFLSDMLDAVVATRG